MNDVLNWQSTARILLRHFRFYLSRQIGYPLVEPDMLQLCFLFRCNLRCKMCNMHERSEIVKQSGLNSELPYEVIINLIMQAREMGIKQLFLLGGEPFLREDIFEIIKFANTCNMKTLVSTNGTLLDRLDIVDKMFASGLEDLVVSIDGACEDTFKKIRGEGIFQRILSNINLLNSKKKAKKSFLPNIVIFCTIMDHNIEELLDIVDLARKLEVACIGFQPVVSDNTDARIRDNPDSNWIPRDRYPELDRAINKLVEYKLSSKENFDFIFNGVDQLQMVKWYFRGTLPKQKCYTGFNRMIVSQDGKMYFCAQEPMQGEISFGDIYKDSLRQLWYSRKANTFRKCIKQCANPCLLGCTRREEFDGFMNDCYRNFYFSPVSRGERLKGYHRGNNKAESERGLGAH